MSVVRTVPLALLAVALAAGDAPSYRNTPSVSLTLTATSPADVAKGVLFVSADNGTTWQKAAEVPAQGGQPVVFAFTAPGDGTYVFKTCAIYQPGKGTSEPDPVPGILPPNTISVVVDTTAPTVRTLRAGFAEIERGTGPLTLRVTWAVEDANIASAALQVSIDEGRTWTDQPGDHAASGDASISMTLAPEVKTVFVRVKATDQAGNEVTSGPSAVSVPVARDPEADLRKAVTDLPAVADLIPPEPKKPEPKPAVTPAAKPAAKPVATTTTAPPPIEDQPASAPSTTDPQPVAQGPRPLTGKPAIRNGNGGADLPSTVPVDVPFLVGTAAAAELANARAAVQSGDNQRAMAIYLRLHLSDVAKTAVVEELALARTLGAWQAVVDIASTLPPELMTDQVRVEYGTALSAIGRDAEAVTVLSRIGVKGPQARRGMLQMARALRNLGKTESSTKLLQRLATGADDVAAEAKAELPASGS
jgi:hypothetical protein